MATRKVKDEKGREYEIDVDDDDDDDDDSDGPFIDESELRGLFDKWLEDKAKNPPKKKGAIRIKSSQPKAPQTNSRTRKLRLA